MLKSVQKMQPHLVGYDVNLCQKSQALLGAPVGVWEAQGTCHLGHSPSGIYQALPLAPAQPCLPGSQVRRRLTAKAIRCPSQGGRGCAGPSQPMPRLPTWLCSAPLNAPLRLNPAQPSPSSREGAVRTGQRGHALPSFPGGAGLPLGSGGATATVKSQPELFRACRAQHLRTSTLCKWATRRPSHPPDKAWLPNLWPTQEIPVGLPGIEEGQGPRHQAVSFFLSPGFHL